MILRYPLLRLFAVFAATALMLQAEEDSARPAGKEPPEKKQEANGKTDKTDKEEKPKEEKPKEVNAAVTLGGVEVKYLAQSGTMPVLKEDGAKRADVFYIYYAATGADGKRLAGPGHPPRPITFCFNGGPGASSAWLHLGGLGPRTVQWPPEGLTTITVGAIGNNENSILDATDLVFIDPVSTGLSRVAKGEKAEQFFGVDEDIESIGEFIRLFVTREQRWGSPKYLCGESYGVLRGAGVADYLQGTHGMYFEGLILISGLLNWQGLSADPGNDLPYILALPTLTAVAHYHQKLGPELQANFDLAVKESRAFARGEYATALLKGRVLAETERKSIAAHLARLTGLTAEQIGEQELRIRPEFFREMLLRKEGKILGRFDARVTAEDGNRGRLAPEFDPSLSNVIGAFSANVNAYLRGELTYESDHPYRVLTGLPWHWTGFANKYVSVESRLADAMKENPRLRVFILTGKRDLAVPSDTMHYSIDHLPIPENLRANISWAEFDSGHMMYLYQPDAAKLRTELLRFLKR